MNTSAALEDLTPEELEMVSRGEGEIISCTGACGREEVNNAQLACCAACNRLYVHTPGSC